MLPKSVSKSAMVKMNSKLGGERGGGGCWDGFTKALAFNR